MVSPKSPSGNWRGWGPGRGLLKYIFSYVLENCGEDMEFFNRWYNEEAIATLEGIVCSQFERITYTEAVDMLLNSGESFEYPVSWGVDLQSEHERYLTEKRIGRPVIVTDYPKEIKAFYMPMKMTGPWALWTFWPPVLVKSSVEASVKSALTC